MPILTKEVVIKPTGKMIEYYRNLGYDAKWREPLKVSIDDLSKGSNIDIEILCDLCKVNTMIVPYDRYNKTIEQNGSYTCKDCWSEKRKQTNLLKYNVDNYTKTPEFREKFKSTMKNRYGVEHNSQLSDYKEKYDNTCRQRYGESYRKQFIEKAHHTFFEKTGYSSPFQSPEIRSKIANLWENKYGHSNPFQSPEIRAKANKTLCENGNQKTSKQQLYLHNLYGGKLNYFVKYYATDICFLEEKIVLEYDGGFHDGRVKLGILTQEEFDHKELIRDKIIKSEGYNIIRIKSDSDKLPQDPILLQMLSEAKQYFSETSHSWITFDIDNSRMINAENKDTNGIPYSFGELRRIKDSDLPNSTKENTQESVNTNENEKEENKILKGA